MKGNQQGDDLIINRLFSLLKKNTPFRMNRIKQIRADVFFIETDVKPLIVKGYSSFQGLRLQEKFTDSLKKEGFQQTYSFYRFSEKPLVLNSKFYGIMEYIKKHEDDFSYRTHRNRNDGLELLGSFYNTTRKMAKRYETILPHYNLAEKWQERMSRFFSQLPTLRSYLREHQITELMNWAKFSLNGLKKEQYNFGDTKQPVILHGDVAHHNFVRAKTGKLYLIDFDLIAIGSESMDLLQYANRILPYLNWSLAELAKYNYFKKYLKNRAFLYALIYPTDIFREWNRLLKHKNYRNPKNLIPVMKLTVDQFYLRKQFIYDVKNMIKYQE